MTTSVAWEKGARVGLDTGRSRAAGRTASSGAVRTTLRRLVRLLEDVMFLLLAVLLFPVAILLVGIPLALIVTVLLEIRHGVFLGLLTTAAPVVAVTAAGLFLARFLARRSLVAAPRVSN